VATRRLLAHISDDPASAHKRKSILMLDGFCVEVDVQIRPVEMPRVWESNIQ
jgi:hypothetical protein